MSFLVFKGTIKVIHESVDFPEGSTHAYVCVAAETELQRALEAAHKQAKEVGLAIVTVDGPPMCVPAWRAWLWTAQGCALRDAKKLGVVLTITKDAVDPNVVIGG